MKHKPTEVTCALLVAVLTGCLLPCLVSTSVAQDVTPATGPSGQCQVDLSRPGMMKDIVSNALLLGLDRPETEVRGFLQGAETRYGTGAELLAAAAAEFGVERARLAAEVAKYHHCNCEHGPVLATSDEPVAEERRSAGAALRFAEYVTLHVILHELGHAVIREFDLPVLANEETMADAFATHYLTTFMPDRAVDVLTARATSLMIEAGEVPRAEWTVAGEHNSDARRAHQIAALAVAVDRRKYAPVAEAAGLSADDIADAADYGTEIHRGWRRVLRPLWMPAGLASREVRVRCDDGDDVLRQLQTSPLLRDVDAIVRRFDWHSQVTVHFVNGEGGAGWSRSSRTIRIHSEYISRFLKQGTVAQAD